MKGQILNTILLASCFITPRQVNNLRTNREMRSLHSRDIVQELPYESAQLLITGLRAAMGTCVKLATFMVMQRNRKEHSFERAIAEGTQFVIKTFKEEVRDDLEAEGLKNDIINEVNDKINDYIVKGIPMEGIDLHKFKDDKNEIWKLVLKGIKIALKMSFHDKIELLKHESPGLSPLASRQTNESEKAIKMRILRKVKLALDKMVERDIGSAIEKDIKRLE